MRRNRPPQRKQLGVQIDSELWTRLKILALKQGMDAYQALEAAIKEFLEKHVEDGQ